MQYALILDARVHADASAADAALKGHDGEPLFDIRDVSKVKGIAIGWLANDDGSFSAPPAPPKPEPDTALGFMAFLALFTSAEQAAVISSDDPQIKLFCLMAAGASVVDLADLRTVAGVQQLESLGLIGKGRAKQVLAGSAPTA